MIFKRNEQLAEIKALEKQLEELRKALLVLELKNSQSDQEKVDALSREIKAMKVLTETEIIYTYSLNHMLQRDKKILLCEKEPIPRRKVKLQHYLT